MNVVDQAITSPIEQAMLRQQAREQLRRAIDTWLAHTAPGGSITMAPRKMLRSKAADFAEPAEAA